MSNGIIAERKKVLFVDDDDMQLTSAEFLLKDEYEVFKATSGEEALKYLNNHEFTPNLVLLDILMPEMDGWEVFNRIRAIGYLKNVPIVFLTSVEGEAEMEKAFKLGSADYIIKPCEDEELKGRIKRIIENKTR
jgi:PleD family two-component response regulator